MLPDTLFHDEPWLVETCHWIVAAEQFDGTAPSVTVNDAPAGSVTVWSLGCVLISGDAEHGSRSVASASPLKEGVGLLVRLRLPGLAIVTLGGAAVAVPTEPTATATSETTAARKNVVPALLIGSCSQPCHAFPLLDNPG